MRTLVPPALWALLTLAAVGSAQTVGSPPADPAAPPAPLTRLREVRYAVALESGRLVDGTGPLSKQRGELTAGDVFLYYGRTTDSFGREWSVVGDPAALARVDRWFAIPAGGYAKGELDGRVSLISGWGAGAPLAAGLAGGMDATAALLEAQQPIRVGREWWRDTLEVEAAYLPEIGDLAAVRAYWVPAEIASDALSLLGGRELLGPWPDRPGFGRLHIAPRLPLVFRFDGVAWRLDERPLVTAPFLGLLGNQGLVLDLQGPTEDTGPSLTCWDLVGGHDPLGASVGRLETAPASPGTLATAVRPESNRYLGLFDRASSLWPVAAPAITAPRKVEPELPAGGVVLSDQSRRQAVYLEQRLSGPLVQRLRGRDVRFTVWARAQPQGADTVSITVSIELEAGSMRQVTSGPVGALPTRLEVLATIPADVESIAVRLVPVDLSVAVTEGGSAVFDRAVLAPASWPVLAAPAALYLYRVRATSYSPARRYTRARLTVSERSAAELEAAWLELENGDFDDMARPRILGGMLEPGMAEREVRIAWGEPRTRSTGGTLSHWEWDDRSAAFGEDGRLVAWQREAEPLPPVLPVCHGVGP